MSGLNAGRSHGIISLAIWLIIHHIVKYKVSRLPSTKSANDVAEFPVMGIRLYAPGLVKTALTR